MKPLKGKVIYIFGTGAKKITHISKMIREFIYEGADIYTMMSDMGSIICDTNLRDFNIKGNTLVKGYSREGEILPLEDLILVAPCTFNTLNKIAYGVADTYPLTVVASAIGTQRNVIIAPAMDKNLWYHPVVAESVAKLERWGCKIIWPEINMRKVTMAPIEKIADTVHHVLSCIRYDSEQRIATKLFYRLVADNYSEFKDVGALLEDADLTKGSAGFLSKRVDGGILVSSSGSQVGNLYEDDLSLIVDVSKNKICWMGKNKPSSESPLLVELHKQIPDGKAIIHGHCARVTYDYKMQKYASSNYLRTGYFGEGIKLLQILNSNDGFAILKLHGEIAIGGSLMDSFDKLKLRMEESHGK